MHDCHRLFKNVSQTASLLESKVPWLLCVLKNVCSDMGHRIFNKGKAKRHQTCDCLACIPGYHGRLQSPLQLNESLCVGMARFQSQTMLLQVALNVCQHLGHRFSARPSSKDSSICPIPKSPIVIVRALLQPTEPLQRGQQMERHELRGLKGDVIKPWIPTTQPAHSC